MNPAKRREIFTRLRADNPTPKTELEHRDPFELLVAVILSAQATDRSVNLVTPALFAKAPDAASMLALGVDGLVPLIRTIGLYPSKAKHLIEACSILVAEHGGRVPSTREALEKLPGVGRKTANVVLNVAFGQPTIAVDTHIFRVANRTKLAPGKDPAAVEQALMKHTPEEFRLFCHHWLILLGRYVCKARKPECWRCPIVDPCEFKPKTPAPATR